MRCFLLVIVFLVGMAASAMAQSNSCTQVTNGSSTELTAFSTCKNVTNSSGTTVCAVTNVDSTQWASFYNNPPSGVTIGTCCAGAGGYSYDGYCYFKDATGGQSCDTVCSGTSRPTCSSAGTNNIGNSDAKCQAMNTYFGGIWGGTIAGQGTIGCYYNNYKSANTSYRSTDGVYCASLGVLYNRYCACN
jgi:hypothetical protein